MPPAYTAAMFPRPVRRRWQSCLLLGLALTLGGCQPPGMARKNATSKGILPPMSARANAPELQNGLAWLNTDRPLSLKKDLKGHVVILDFWTYCCINCIHVLPDLKFLEHKYRDQPFAVVGVHSAKFENEGTRQNVRSAILRYEIEHPVVVDDRMAIWQEYGIRSWPSLVLIDTQGKVVGVAPGEGNRAVLDQYVGALLAEGKENKTLAARPLRVRREGMVRPAGGLAFPGKVLADAAGQRLFIADSNHNRVVVARWPSASGHAPLLQVIGEGKAGQRDGAAARARFDHPQGLALGADTLYVADTEAHTLRAVSLKDWTVKTIAGTGQQVYDRRGGAVGVKQGLNSPWDLALDEKNNRLYIAMAGPHQLWQMDLKTGRVANFAGSGVEDIVDGDLSQAALAQPSGLALAGDRLYFADSEVSAIRYADLKKERVQTVIGEGLFAFGDVDGKHPRARLQHALGVAPWGGQLLVADTYNHKIKLVDPDARSSASFLGLGRPGAGEGDRLALYEPGGLAVSGETLFVADTNNHRVVMVNLGDKSWREVMVEGLEAPAGEEDAKGPATVLTDPHTVDPAKPTTLTLRVDLPAPWALNHEAPTSVRVSAGGKTVFTQTLHTGGHDVTVTLPPGAFKGPGETTLTVALRSAYCDKGEGGACVPLSLTWQSPLTLKPGGETTLLLTGSETPPKAR